MHATDGVSYVTSDKGHRTPVVRGPRLRPGLSRAVDYNVANVYLREHTLSYVCRGKCR